MNTIQLTSAQTRFIYLFNGLAPVATCIVTPLMAQWGLRNKPIAEARKKDIVTQEVARQAVSGAIGLAFYFGGGAMTKRLLAKIMDVSGKAMQPSTRHILTIVGAAVAYFIGYGFVRPLLGNELIVRLLSQKGLISGEGPGVASGAVKPMPNAATLGIPASPVGAVSRLSGGGMQGFMQDVAFRSGNPSVISQAL